MSFTKIFNSESFNDVYDPLDVVATTDSGYLLLAAKSSWSPYLLKADAQGVFSWDQTLPEPFVNPLPDIYSLGNELFIICMDELNLSTYILRIQASGGQPEIVYNDDELTYPLAASITPDGGWLLQGYNREGRQTLISKISPGFTREWRQTYPILEDVEEKVIKHLSRTGQRLPFFNGYAAGSGNAGFYYFNGFNNFTLSLTFIDPTNGEQIGVMNGFRDLSYISAALPLEGELFALAKNSYGDNYLFPQSIVNERSISASNELEANNFPEIAPDARVLISREQILGREVLLFNTHTKSKRLVIYAYDAADGSLIGLKYLGQTSPYETGNLVRTQDGGLMVMGKTYVAGRFPRLCLFKLTKEEVEDILLR
ncbi:MAG: hypothetical protein ACLFUB_12480 [Cyclobacteriaceae bacterium]